MTLKIRQVHQNAKTNNEEISKLLKKQKQYWLFGNCKIFDIFDEVDALVTPKKSFVYAIGGSEGLPSANIRIELCKYLLEIFIK